MPITRIDAIQLFDIDLGEAGKLPDLRTALGVKSPSECYSRCNERFMWLFEPPGGDGRSQDDDPMVAFNGRPELPVIVTWIRSF